MSNQIPNLCDFCHCPDEKMEIIYPSKDGSEDNLHFSEPYQCCQECKNDMIQKGEMV